MPTLGELDEEQRAAFSGIWSAILEIRKDGGPRYLGLVHNPIDVRVTRGHHVFTFPDGLFGMPSPDRLYVLRPDGAFLVYDAETGHCRSAQLGPALHVPVEELHTVWRERGEQARWC